MNWMDVVTIIILTVSALYGLATGLILSLVKIASVIISFIVAKLYYIPLSTYIINKTSIYKGINNFIASRIGGIVGSGQGAIDSATRNTLENLNLPKVLESDITTKVDGLTQGLDTISLTTVISSIIINIVSIILIFVVVRITIMIIGRILDKVASVPIINEFNKVGGFAFGLIKGALGVFLLTALMIPLASISPNNFIIETIHASKITCYFYDYNLILYIFNEMVFSVGL